MRTDIPQAIIDALAEDATSTVQIRLSGGRTRAMNWERNAEKAPAWADAPGAQDEPLAQDFCMVGGMGYSVLVYGGELWICNQFNEPMRPTVGGITIDADDDSRPVIRQGRNESELRVYYCTGMAIQSIDVDRGLVDAGTAECVLEGDTYSFPYQAALHAVSLDEVVALWIDDGGIRVTLIDTQAATEESWQGRFMFPGVAVTDDHAGSSLQYSAAVEYDGRVFIYLSAPTGELMGVSYRRSNGAWSDSFTAIPTDMSRFLAGKALLIDEAIYLAGMLYRYDRDGSFTAGVFYTLLLRSTDGRTFAMDRTTTVAGGQDTDTFSMALRFLVGYSETPDSAYTMGAQAAYTNGAHAGAPLLVFSDGNRWFAQEAHYGIDGVVKGYDFRDCILSQVRWGQMFDVTVPFDENQNADQIQVGDVAELYFGVRVPDGPLQEFLAARCMVMVVREAASSGSRSLTVSVVSFSDGKLLEMAHPFAIRKPGKTFLHDTLAELDNFDLASEDGFVSFPLAVDFWNNGQVTSKTHNALEEWEYTTNDLDEDLDIVELPEITELPFEIHCFGWSRSGRPSVNDDNEPQEDNPTDPLAPNDAIYVKLYIQRDGQADDVVVTVDTPAGAGYDHFPQTWKATADGDYPVILEAEAGLQVGDRIKKVGIVFSNTRTPNTAETVFVAERVEMPTLMTQVRSFRDSWKETQVENEAGDPEDGQALQRIGIPVVQFAQEPYYALGCQASLKMAVSGESAYAGVVCLASDGLNYVCARASATKVQLVLARAGDETILAEAAYSFPTPMGWIMLRYQDGLFRVYVKSAVTNQYELVLEYEWTEANGALLVDDQISHVGIYAFNDGAYVKICGLDLEATNGVGILPLAHKFDNFPAAGRIRVDDCVYSYDSKISGPDPVGGPYQGRNVSGPYSYTNDGEAYSGNAAEFLRFEWITNGSNSEKFLNKYLATDTGIVWKIGLTDFKPYITTEGDKISLRNRGRFFCAQADADVIGKSVRVWITNALLGLKRISGEETTHRCGTVAYISSETSAASIFEFAAIVDGKHLTDREALDWIARVCRAEASFPGDSTVENHSLAAAWEAR